MPTDLLADIALRATIKTGASPVFSYRVPPSLRGLLRPGQLVWVSLRRRQVQGVVLHVGEADSAHIRGLRDIERLADPEANIPAAGLHLAAWVAETYRAPLYEALELLLPPGVGQASEVTWRATAAGVLAELGALPERERAVLYYLRLHGEQSEKELRGNLRGSDSELREAYRTLAERGLLVPGTVMSAARARPRRERLARLDIPLEDLDAALNDLERAPKQAAALRWFAAHEPALLGRFGPRLQGRSAVAGNGRRVAEPDERGDWEHDSAPAEFDGRWTAWPPAEIYAGSGATAQTLRELERRGLLAFETREVRRDPLAGAGVPPDLPPPLTPAQRTAYEAIVTALEAGRADRGTGGQGDRGTGKQEGEERISPLSTDGSASRLAGPRPPAPGPRPPAPIFLLHGVTGSGKTEVYLRTIARTLRLGRQALVLVPEIALTAQLVRRFAARFPGKLAVLHSGLGLGERYDEWRRLRRGEARLAIGSRSAVFAPLPELGLIIVDEEHELTYKHDAGPRYHARDAAVRLAALNGSVLVLGSATPSVESYQAARTGRYRLLEMRERVGGGLGADGLHRSEPLPLPPVRLVDMRRELQRGNRSIFSHALQQALDETLERRQQAILFLNRRGAAAFVMCRDCGHVLGCAACSNPLTVHYVDSEGARPPSLRPPGSPTLKASDLICHSCGFNSLLPTVCPSCLSPRIKSFGVGTQRVVEEVAALFPQARTLRWDRDSVSGKGAHSRMLDMLLRGEADVLVGTQMIAKGLDLPQVAMVGVVAADTGLQLPDFRSGERAFQLLTQVAGRAGRRSEGAQVIVQTYNPEHYALRAAQEHDYQSFFVQEIAYRRETGYPPFGRLVRFVYGAGTEPAGKREAERLGAALLTQIERRRLEGWGLIGPAPAFIQRVRGRWRWHLILRIPIAQAYDAPLRALLDALEPLRGWTVDVDPAHVL